VKINLTPVRKLALVSAVLCGALLAFSPNASALALQFNDTHVVGTITPASPADPGNVVNYVNFMIGLAPGASGDFHNPPHTQHITRSTNLFASLPTALEAGAVTGTGTTINLGAGGVYSYLFAKYDGQNDISQVWYVGNLSGTITIPQNGPTGHGLSGWILFPPGGQVHAPDGGTTVMLLGVALSTLGMARRYLKR
jgi:hypothetical protein